MPQKAVDAVKGMAWESPRGPVSIDPESRHITQNIYLREVAKAEDGTYYNKEIQTFEKHAGSRARGRQIGLRKRSLSRFHQLRRRSLAGDRLD